MAIVSYITFVEYDRLTLSSRSPLLVCNGPGFVTMSNVGSKVAPWDDHAVSVAKMTPSVLLELFARIGFGIDELVIFLSHFSIASFLHCK